ncbi:MAG TPA: flagellar basal-body MS-ring/collar protein FliF [Candidatus Gastranaerophilaceae bacterium]|nr:flagellar basal-body MS-ring/collar protein FliF [Candidatus Gastranaerophilaceae bacterium]HPT41341.1 flagellar basal-body MS-ring/collar protein FliF [Candidatus Gastranaerophilaceae bacterium]
MNNYFKLVIDDIRKLWNGLDIAQKFGMLTLTIVTFVVATYFIIKSMEPNWAVLYTDLSEPDAVSVVENLKKNGYAYKIADDRKTILVQADKKDELRVFVAENDLIKNSSPGFELLDELPLGSTDFKNKLTKQRIFQGELTRSIENMNGIKSVRIQIADPERSIFEDEDEEPTASVMLILNPGYKLRGSQVKAIKNLVAYAVPRLTPDRVFITDQNGNNLGDENGKNSNDMETFKSNFEKQTSEKVITVLEKIMGKGNATVQVSADINFDSAKSTIESYIPLNDKGEGVLTTSQNETENYANPGQGPAPAAAGGNKNLNYSKEKNSTNYSVSKEIKQVIYAPGTVKRMTIAVAVNKILTPKEKEEIQNLVLSASGADYNRGDVITVSSMQFESIAEDKAAQDQMEKDLAQENNIEFWTTKIAPLLIVLILGAGALIVVKSLTKGIGAGGGGVNVANETYNSKMFEAQLPTIKEEPTDLIENEALPQIEAHLDPELERVRMELNDTILADPSEAARLLTSFIKD